MTLCTGFSSSAPLFDPIRNSPALMSTTSGSSIFISGGGAWALVLPGDGLGGLAAFSGRSWASESHAKARTTIATITDPRNALGIDFEPRPGQLAADSSMSARMPFVFRRRRMQRAGEGRDILLESANPD